MWVFAHGVGSRGDLPLPLWQFTWAATAALVISFVALGALWQEPRLAAGAGGRGIDASRRILRVAEPVARTASFVLFLLVLAAGFFGVDSNSANINPVTIYVLLWIVLQMLVCVVGDVWRVLSPFDTMAIGLERVRSVAPAAAPGWSSWLAPAGALAFLFLELIHPFGDSPRILAYAMLLYTGIVMAGAWRWGRGWLAEGETIALHYGLLAAMAPVGRGDDGRLRLRTPMSGLAALQITMAGVVTLLVVLGGVTFDGFGESELWRDMVGRRTGWNNAWIRFVGLLVSIALVAALYGIAVWAMSRTTKRSSRELALAFAPSLVPIVFGYTLAHYLQLAVDETQTFWFLLSDPFGQGWNLFGAADGRINFDIISTDGIAWVQAAGVVVGHIAGVIVAHDRAITLFSKRDALRSQYVMLLVMVLYSVLGLWLLLNA